MKTRWTAPVLVLAIVNVLFLCVLGLYQTTSAQQPRSSNQPFPNPEEQRGEMINLLTEIKALVKEQNALLRSGDLRVVVTTTKKR
jgi:hypothetical protein